MKQEIVCQRSSETAVQDASNPRGSCTTSERKKDGKGVSAGEREIVRSRSLFHPFVVTFHFSGNTDLGRTIARGVLCFFRKGVYSTGKGGVKKSLKEESAS